MKKSRSKKTNILIKIVLSILLIIIVICASMSPSINTLFRPYYSHKQCKDRFDICEPKILKYAQTDIEFVRAYLGEKYGIKRNKIDIIGCFLRMQGLEVMRVYTYRVELVSGYAFTFSMNDFDTKSHLKTFGYEYVKSLDELQGIIVGVLHEALTGKDYQEIEAIFEAENLFTLK